MKNFNYIILLLALFILVVSCGDDEKSTNEPDIEIDQALVGSWELTKILQPIATTPSAVGIALTAVFSSDGTLEFTTTDADGLTVDTGTWRASDGKLTITLEGVDPETSDYSIVENITTINGFPVEFQGTVILATLEFTKSQ